MNEKKVEHERTPSKIRQLFEYGKKKKLEIGEENVYDFSIGNPSVPTPSSVNEVLISLLKDSENNRVHSYTSSMGDTEVRNSIADFLNKTYGCSLEGRFIYLTCGAAAALAISFNAILNDDDEVILFAPHFPDYAVFIENARGKIVRVNPNTKDFTPDLDDFSRKINEKTRIVVINSPCNPTGVLFKEELIVKIANILKENEKKYHHPIYIVSDEPYRELNYTQNKYPFISNYYDNSLICYSFSKVLSLPGERIGYVTVNPKAENVQDLFYAICGAGWSLGYICAPTLYQFMIPHVLGITCDISIYDKNRNLLYESLKEIGYEAIYPEGAFYLFVKALEDDEEHFSEMAKDYNLLLVPSTSFGIKGYVRVSYCVKEETIKNSIPSFKKLFMRYH